MGQGAAPPIREGWPTQLAERLDVVGSNCFKIRVLMTRRPRDSGQYRQRPPIQRLRLREFALLTVQAVSPRTPPAFLSLTALLAASRGGCYAAALGLVMSSIGRGAASTKAAVLWSLFNFSGAYPALVDGRVHDQMGTTAMLLTHAGIDAMGFGILVLLANLLKVPLRPPSAPAAAAIL